MKGDINLAKNPAECGKLGIWEEKLPGEEPGRTEGRKKMTLNSPTDEDISLMGFGV